MLPTDEELARGRAGTEDNLTERKTSSDAGDWLKTVVAFANSAPLDRYGVLYIGVTDRGEVEPNVNLDQLQKTLKRRVEAAYPPISYQTRVLNDGDRSYLCVLVAGSAARPHFAGAAFVRIGCQTIDATQSEYDRLISQRNSKTYKILQYRGNAVGVDFTRSGPAAIQQGRVASMAVWHVVDCSGFCAMFRDQYGQGHSVALDRIQILEEPNSAGAIRLEIRND
jgi:hypothetical protein